MDPEEILKEDAENYLVQEASRRRFLYRDVEELLEFGFLQHAVTMEDRTVVFRSLQPSQLQRLYARTSRAKTKAEYLSWGLATSVWMVDGYEIPSDSAHNGAYHIHQELFGKMPSVVLENLAVITTGFQNRLAKALRMTEAFCYEPYGRSLWRLLGKPAEFLRDAPISRRIWAAHNLAEDGTSEDDREWRHTQAIISSLSNKAAKHISEAMQKHRDAEEGRRQRIIEDAVNWVIRGDVREEPLMVKVNGKLVQVNKIHGAKTTADLQEEMRKVFAGEVDYHDAMVNEWHEQIRRRTEERRTTHRNAVAEARRKFDEAGEDAGTKIVGYTLEQMRELHPEALEKRMVSEVSESGHEQYLFDRYIAPRIIPGKLTPSLKVESVEPEGESLQDRIANRKPKLG